MSDWSSKPMSTEPMIDADGNVVTDIIDRDPVDWNSVEGQRISRRTEELSKEFGWAEKSPDTQRKQTTLPT